MKSANVHLNLLKDTERLSSSPVRLRVMLPVVALFACLGMALWWAILFTQLLMIKAESQTIDEDVKVKGQEDAYKTIVTGAVGGAAGVIHAADSAHTDCEPNANVEALRVALDKAQIEARPVWKPMHKQPVYLRNIENGELKIENLPCGAVCQTSATSVAYVNGVSEAIFKVGMCLPAGPYVSDDDVRYIVDTIKASIIG